MPKQNDGKSEQVLNILSDYGYSKRVVAEIWRWYTCSEKAEAVTNSKPIVEE
jgi:hypothetical protein